MRKLKTLMLGATVALGSGGYLSTAFAEEDEGPPAGLTKVDAAKIFNSCVTTALKTDSTFGRPKGKGTKMWCAVIDREGETLLIKATDTKESPGPRLKTDAWRASIEIAEAKAYTALSVSSNDLALDSKTVGFATRIDKGSAPLFGLGDTNPFRLGTGNPSLSPDDKTGVNHHGIVTFAGGQPVYNCTTHLLVGGVGVSGDGVDQDDAVAIGAVTGAGFCLKP